MLNYKKILLDNGVESGNQSPVERTDEQRLNDLRKEINELVDNNQQNDSIDTIANDMVNDSLKQAISKLQINERLHLLAIVDKAIQSQADGNIKTSLTKLRGLLDTNEQNEANSDFQRFENFIVKRNFSKLNSLKNNIDDIVKHINQMSTTDAVWLLSKMKPDGIDQTSGMGSLVGNGHKTDRAVYDAILLAISNKVEGKSEKGKDQRDLLKQDEYGIIKEQLNQFFGNNPKAKDLQELLYLYSGKTDWNGNDIGDIIPSSGNPKLLFNNVQFGSKFKELNDKRINNNKAIVQNIRISIDDINGFTIDNNTIKYQDNEVTINDMIKICNLNLNGCDFLNNKERDDLLTSKFDEFKNQIKEKLKKRDIDQNGEYKDLANGERGRLMTKERIDKINKQAEKNVFLEAVNNDSEQFSYKYNLTKAKAYLQTFDKNFKRKELKDDQKLAYVAAVQILLNNTEGNSGKIKIDGEFGRKTEDRVKEYQESKGLKKDGIPGPNTLKDLLGMGQATREVGEEPEIIGIGLNKTVIEDDLRNNLGIPNEVTETNRNGELVTKAEDITVYTRNDDTHGLYYKYNGDLFRISTKTPWLKQKITIPKSEDRRIDDGEILVNSCEAGINKLKGMLGDNSRTILKSFNDTEYNGLNDAFGIVINNSEGTKVCDILLGTEFFTNDFCGISNIEDKMKIIQLVGKMRLEGKTNITLNGNTIDNYTTEFLKGYGITPSNINQFITEYNNIQDNRLFAFGSSYQIKGSSNGTDQAGGNTT